MAETKGIRRFLELVLDKAKAQKTQREAQDAINKGTDPRKAQQNLSAVDRAFDRIGKTALRIGSAIAAAFALNRIKDFATSSIKEFSAAEAVWSQLEGTLKNVGVAMSDVQGELDGVVSSMGRLSTMGDEDVAQSLQTLVQLSGDYRASLGRLQLVADLAAGANLDFAQASEIVGKAMAGNTLALTKMFPALKGSKDILGDLAKIQDGMALRQRGTWAGATKILSDEWANFKEAVGKALTEAGGGVSIIESLAGAVRGLGLWIGEHQSEIDAFATSIAAIVESLENLPQYWRNLAAGRRLLDDGLTPLEREGIAFELGRMGTGGGTVTPPPRLPPVIPSKPTPAELKAAEDRIKAIWAHLGDFLARTQGHGELAAGILDRFAGLSEEGKRKLQEDEARIASFLKAGGKLGGVTAHGGTGVMSPEDLQLLENEARLLENLGDVASNVADTITDSFRRAFGIMREEGATTGNFIKGVFEGVGGALLGGLAQFAEGKVKENIALAIEEGARALGFTALGNFASSSAAAGAAAGHLAAAAAWGALSGGAGAAGSAVTGGHRGGSNLSSNRDAGAGIAQRAERVGPEVNIYLTGEFDMLNPKTQRAIFGTMQYATETFGEGSKITVKPSPGR